MKTRFAASVVMTGAVAVVAGAARQVPRFTTGAEAVSLDVSVSDGHRLVTGLSPSDFKVLDGGVAQHVESAQAGSFPIDVSLVVDMGFRAVVAPRGTHPLQDFEHEARGLAARLRPDDRLALITAATAVDEIRPLEPVGPDPGGLQFRNPTVGGWSSLFDALLLALTQSPETPERPHLMIVLCRGLDAGSILPADDLVAVARRSAGVVYAVMTPRVVPGPPNGQAPQYPIEAATARALDAAADATGGSTLLATDAVGALDDVLDRFRGSYVLRYTVTGVVTGGWHTLAVAVPKCPNCTIRARQGYFGE